jgi:hypothetical protein
LKKTIIMALLSTIVPLVCVLAQEASFSEVNGKVEYQTGADSWKPARTGDTVGKGVVISTGFKSTAVLMIGKSSISIKPLTRMTLEDIVKTEGGTQSQLFLLAGRVKADIPPQPGQTTEFKVKSPTATASVRGTGFEFDGVNLIVEHGAVQLMTATGQTRMVGAGEFSYVARGGVVAPPSAVVIVSGLDSVVELVVQSVAESLSTAVAAPPPPLQQTSVVTIGVQ